MTTIRRNIKRLLLYKLCLYRFKELGFETVYSYSIGNASGVSAAQVRKDFAEFGIKGNKRGGYNIDELLDEFTNIFGSEVKNIIVVGMGNIGRAIAQYSPRFSNKSLRIVAGFDIDPSKQKKMYNLPVYSLKKLPEVIKNYEIKAAIIAVPGQMAQKVCDILVEKGVKGFLNFSPVILQAPDDVVINDINLSNELESIIYNTTIG
jgi:redox-sensing transcriptional repressor